MKTKTWLAMLMLTSALTFTFTGCKRDGDDDETATAADQALAEQTFNDVNSIADEGSTGSVENFKTGGTLTHCATVTLDTANGSDPDTITIDFGTTNCTGHDLRTRRGKIIVVYTGRYRDAGSSHTITFDNYFVNDNQVLGTKTVTNMGQNGNGHTYFDISVDGSIVLADGSGTITYVSDRTREWIEGESTLALSDDVYLITGTASGTNALGNTFDAEITEALRVQLNCRWVTDGKLELTPGDKPTRTIDYGDGTCDNEATVTVNGRTFDILLR